MISVDQYRKKTRHQLISTEKKHNIINFDRYLKKTTMCFFSILINREYVCFSTLKLLILIGIDPETTYSNRHRYREKTTSRFISIEKKHSAVFFRHR